MPRWLEECKSSLSEVDNSGLYVLNNANAAESARFMATCEVEAGFQSKGEPKRIHLIILCPNLDVADQVADRISKYGDLNSDGRPKLRVAAAELTEVIMEIDNWNEVIPAHAWTPWFSLFGSRSGFDRIEECFQDQTKNVHAIETGLSSDPMMNWRLSALDKYTLVSNSDSHSPWPYRLGREANVFQLDGVTYKEIIDVIRKKDPKRFLMTIETNPEYGKYHYTGHRDCNVVLSPKEASKYGNMCPVCRKKLTVGVLHRIEELADRPEGYILQGAIPYVCLIPLQEIISVALGMKDVFAKGVWEEYGKLLKKFPNELHVLLEASREEISSISGARLADAILRVREKKIRFRPGYDGTYGYPIIFEDEAPPVESSNSLNEKKESLRAKDQTAAKPKQGDRAQQSLSDYF